MKKKELHIALDRIQGLTLTLALERLSKLIPIPNMKGKTRAEDVAYRDGWFACYTALLEISDQLEYEMKAKTNLRGFMSLSDLRQINKEFRGN